MSPAGRTSASRGAAFTTPVRHSEPASAGSQSTPACPLCAEDDVAVTTTPHTFDHGTGDSMIELHVRIPVCRCNSCRFEFLDDAAEHLKHRAICRHLGVLAPAEIRRIREHHGMIRAQFARLTGLDDASLGRWEKGLSIQTRAIDRHLRLFVGPDSA